METIILIVKILVAIGGGIVINKTTEDGHFEWIKKHLRLTWIVFLLFILFLFVSDSYIWGIIMDINKQYVLSRPTWIRYVSCFVLGGLFLCGIYWISGKISGSNNTNKQSSSKVIITARELALIPFIDNIENQNFIVYLSFYNEGIRDCSIEEIKLLIPNEQTLLAINDNDHLSNNYNNKLNNSSSLIISSTGTDAPLILKTDQLTLKINQLFQFDYKIPAKDLRKYLSIMIAKHIYRYPLIITLSIVDYKGDASYIKLPTFAEIRFNDLGIGGCESTPKSIDYLSSN